MNKTDEILISVIIPCYNIEKYIKNCLESVCKQTHKNLEIICVDDGSTDNTACMIEEIKALDDRINIIKQNNKYAGIARNNGMKYAKGKYIYFLDGDDFIEPNMLELMISSALACDSDIVLCDAYLIDEKTGEISATSLVLNHDVLKKCGDCFSYRDINDSIFDVTWGVVWNKLYKKDFIESNNLSFQTLRRHNDEYFVSLSMVLASKISYVDKRLVFYRVNIPNSLQAYDDNNIEKMDFYDSLLSIKKGLIDKGLYNSVKKSFLDKCLCSFMDVLEKQSTFEGYKNIFVFLKQTAFVDFEISVNMSTSHPEAIDKLKRITSESAEDYLFKNHLFNKKIPPTYIFPYKAVGPSRNIALYGAGNVGKEYFRQLLGSNYYVITAWFDKKYADCKPNNCNILSLDTILDYSFDRIIIAVDRYEVYREIKKIIIDNGIPEGKIVWK